MHAIIILYEFLNALRNSWLKGYKVKKEGGYSPEGM